MSRKRSLYFMLSLALSCYYGDVFAAKNCREGEYDLDNTCVECPEDAYCPTSGKKSEWSTKKNGGKRPDCWSGSDYSSYGIYCCPKDYPYTKGKGKVHDTNCYKNDYPNLARIFKDGRTEELPHVNVPAGKFGDSDECTAGCYCDGYKMAYVDPHYRDVEDFSRPFFNDHQNYRKMLTAYCKRDEKLFKEAADRISNAMPIDKLNFEYIEKIYSNLGMYRCPSEYPQSDKGAKVITECYKLDGSTKVYLTAMSWKELKDSLQQLKDSSKQESTAATSSSPKYVSCPAGKYLPAGGSSADACKDCREDHACAGSDRLMPNASMDQGIIKCATGKKPNSAKTACVIGTGIKVTGIDKKRKDDIIAKKDGKEISDKSGDVKCAAGKYLPGGKKECKVCEGVNKYCPGGEFDFADEDQGIHSCPTGGNVNGNKSGCRIKLSKSSMYYGTGQRASNIQQQCWIIKDVEEYASCVLPKD